MLKLNGVSIDAIRLHLFPFSLRDSLRDKQALGYTLFHQDVLPLGMS